MPGLLPGGATAAAKAGQASADAKRFCSRDIRLGYERPLPLGAALALLRGQLDEPGHEFWPDDISLADSHVFDHARLRGPGQITDVYLLALAVKRGGRL